MRKMTLKAGKYMIGDPGLCIDNDLVYKPTMFDDGTTSYENGGHAMWYCVAQSGRGNYYALKTNGSAFKIVSSSSTIGAIPIQFIAGEKDLFPFAINKYWNLHNIFDLNANLGRVIDFKEDFEVYAEDGTIHFGDIVVKTKKSGQYE